MVRFIKSPAGLASTVALCFAFPAAAFAQAPCPCEHRAAVHATMWVGATTESRHLWLGYVEDARLREVGVGITWSHPIASAAAIEAAISLIPYVGFTRQAAEYWVIDEQGDIVDVFSSTPNARGWGFVPLDIGIRGFTRSRVNTSLGVFFGLISFNRPVPNTTAERLNYIFGLRGGIEMPLNPRTFLFTGVRVQHVSNGGTDAANQGVENVMFRFGYGVKVR